MLLLPIALNQISTGHPGLSREDADQLLCRLAAIERLDERLNDTYCSIVGASIAPRLEIMRFGHMPLAKFGRFVAMAAEKYLQTDGARLQCRRELKFCGRVIGWIAAEDQQQVNF